MSSAAACSSDETRRLASSAARGFTARLRDCWSFALPARAGMTEEMMTSFRTAAVFPCSGFQRMRSGGASSAAVSWPCDGASLTSRTAAASGCRRSVSTTSRGGSMTSCQTTDVGAGAASFMLQSPKVRSAAESLLRISMSRCRLSFRIEPMTRSTPSAGPSSHWKKRLLS